jgi:branched-chain amino acid transport system substrate-binding protein
MSDAGHQAGRSKLRRLVLNSRGAVVGGDRGVSGTYPELVTHARRARNESYGTIRYYWRDSVRGLLRVTVEVVRTDGGPQVMLAAEPIRSPWGLTVREHEVLTGVVAGMTNPEIASWLRTTRRTVATHVERILDKLGVPTRAGAAALATAGQELLAPLPGGNALVTTPVGRVTALDSDTVRATSPCAVAQAWRSARSTVAVAWQVGRSSTWQWTSPVICATTCTGRCAASRI